MRRGSLLKMSLLSVRIGGTRGGMRVSSSPLTSCSCRFRGHAVPPLTRRLSLSSTSLAKTHYQTLGISQGANQAEIKKAYYALSMRHHPDKEQGCDEKFRSITVAYEVLGNPRLRRMYDRGLLSDEQPDASIHYPAESGGAEGYSPEMRDSIKETVKTFDQWAQSHTSDTFAKAQEGRATTRKVRAFKDMKDSSKEENKVIFFFIGAILLVGMIYSVWDKGLEPRTKGKK